LLRSFQDDWIEDSGEIAAFGYFAVGLADGHDMGFILGERNPPVQGSGSQHFETNCIGWRHENPFLKPRAVRIFIDPSSSQDYIPSSKKPGLASSNLPVLVAALPISFSVFARLTIDM
jgi:hypothetical protein